MEKTSVSAMTVDTQHAHAPRTSGPGQPELDLGLGAALTPAQKAARTRRRNHLLGVLAAYAAAGCCAYAPAWLHAELLALGLR